jgi:hypothetical protein
MRERGTTSAKERVMSSKEAWEEVSSGFAGLGLKLKEHFAQATSHEGAETGSAERSDEAAKDALRDALQKLGSAFEDAFAAMSSASKDKAIAEDVRKVGQSMIHAVQSTFGEVSDDLRNAFSRSRRDDN